MNFFVKSQKRLILMALFSSFFTLISFGKIGSLNITLPFIVLIVYFVISSVGLLCGQISLEKKRFFSCLSILLTALFSCLASKYSSNVSSLLLYWFYFALPMMLDSRKKIYDFLKIEKKYVIFASIFSFFGILQFVSYNLLTSLPFKEFIPEILWTDDMNVFTTVHGYHIFGKEVVRAHSIYSEPSVFSQITAISILLLIKNCKFYGKVNYLLLLLINLIGELVSFSGTGFLILIFVACIYFCKIAEKQSKTKMLFAIVFLLLFVFLFRDSDIVKYFLGRAMELSATSKSYNSGQYRFLLPFSIGVTKPLGFGVGNDDVALTLFNAQEKSIANGFGKIFVELGFMGLLELLIFYLFVKPRDKTPTAILWYAIILISDVVGTFMMPMFWCFALYAFVLGQAKQPYKRSHYEKNTAIYGRFLRI